MGSVRTPAQMIPVRRCSPVAISYLSSQQHFDVLLITHVCPPFLLFVLQVFQNIGGWRQLQLTKGERRKKGFRKIFLFPRWNTNN